MTKKTTHVGASVRGMLKRSNQALDGVLNDDNGNPLDGASAKIALMELLSQGVEMLPCGDKCDNFDDKKGCLGHEQ